MAQGDLGDLREWGESLETSWLRGMWGSQGDVGLSGGLSGGCGALMGWGNPLEVQGPPHGSGGCEVLME